MTDAHIPSDDGDDEDVPEEKQEFDEFMDMLDTLAGEVEAGEGIDFDDHEPDAEAAGMDFYMESADFGYKERALARAIDVGAGVKETWDEVPEDVRLALHIAVSAFIAKRIGRWWFARSVEKHGFESAVGRKLVAISAAVGVNRIYIKRLHEEIGDE